MNRRPSRAERHRQHWRTASEHEHYIDCHFNEDDEEVVYCTTCGEEW
jgi:hypothetical protein